MKSRILLFSSSKVGEGGYLQSAVEPIHQFLGDAPLRIAFIPFASVNNDYEEYANKVREPLKELPYTIQTVQEPGAKATIEQAEVIMVGGGNTFKLLHDIYALQLSGLIQEKVNSGTPYIGWSAGANIAGASICTSNDMPIINPGSFEALGFLPFQINPHYYNLVVPGFNGETRDQRLAEFLVLNPGKTVVALPEGTALQKENDRLGLTGMNNAYLFRMQDNKPVQTMLALQDDLSFLLK